MAVQIATVTFEKTPVVKHYTCIDAATKKVLGIVATDALGYGLIEGSDAKYWNRKTAGEALLAEQETGVRPMPAAKGAGFLVPTDWELLRSELESMLEESMLASPTSSDVDLLSHILGRIQSLGH